jgi:prophage minor tail protein Z (GPZ)
MQHFLEVKNIDLAQNMLKTIPNGIERAITGTINRTLNKVKTEIKNKTTSEYNIKKSDIESKLNLTKATFSVLRGTIVAKTPRLALSKFLTSQSKSQIKVKIKKTENSKIVKGKNEYTGKPFITTMKSGHKGIFQRKNNSRFPIKELYTIGISEMLGSENVSSYAVEKGEEYLDELLLKEVSRILKGYI